MTHEIISRDDARSLNNKYYFTGEPCKYGHIYYRYVSCGSCVSCDLYSEKRIARRKFLYYSDIPKERERKKKLYLKNKEHIKNKSSQWRKNNPEKTTSQTNLYRARKLSATPLWADFDLINDIYIEARYQGLHVDHIIPLTSSEVCGLHWEGNLQLLTNSENASKCNKILEVNY